MIEMMDGRGMNKVGEKQEMKEEATRVDAEL
jgi:hypothetical protein